MGRVRHLIRQLPLRVLVERDAQLGLARAQMRRARVEQGGFLGDQLGGELVKGEWDEEEREGMKMIREKTMERKVIRIQLVAQNFNSTEKQ